MTYTIEGCFLSIHMFFDYGIHVFCVSFVVKIMLFNFEDLKSTESGKNNLKIVEEYIALGQSY